jgi:cytochrome c oxidase subunit 2
MRFMACRTTIGRGEIDADAMRRGFVCCPVVLRHLFGAALCLAVVACERQEADTEQASAWDTRTWTPAEIRQLERGRALYVQKCAACHLRSGEGQVTLGAPALRGSAIVRGPVAVHIDTVLYGRGAGVMPAFAGVLDDRAVADIVSYERNAWGNSDPALVSIDGVRSRRER